MAVLELCPASSGPCFWRTLASWGYGLAGPGFIETMLWQALFWQLSGGPCAPGGAFVQPIFEEGRMAMLQLCPAQDKPDKAAFPFIFELTGACPSTFHEGFIGAHGRSLDRPDKAGFPFISNRRGLVRLHFMKGSLGPMAGARTGQSRQHFLSFLN